MHGFNFLNIKIDIQSAAYVVKVANLVSKIINNLIILFVRKRQWSSHLRTEKPEYYQPQKMNDFSYKQLIWVKNHSTSADCRPSTMRLMVFRKKRVRAIGIYLLHTSKSLFDWVLSSSNLRKKILPFLEGRRGLIEIFRSRKPFSFRRPADE